MLLSVADDVPWMGLSNKVPRKAQTLWVQMRFQMSPHVAGQPIVVRDQEVEAELIVLQPNGEETSIDLCDDFEGHLGQSIRHVKIIQDAVHILAFNQDEIAVALGAICVTRVCVELQDGHDEGLDGGIQRVVAELLEVGDGFECLHGGSPFDGHKKARRSGWKGGFVREPGRAQTGVVRVVLEG
jgi:hypothetical protein